MSATTHEFRAETRKVLNILTHSLYTNREIFLRELVSNASDALDKARFYQARGEALRHPELPLEIRLEIDKINNILTISDTGLGMTAAELAENLGTIAHSGSEQFIKDLASDAGSTGDAASTGDAGSTGDAAQIIGRFGIGFYSVFMVSDKVEVISTSAKSDELSHVWTSDGCGTFTVEVLPEDRADEAPLRGTKIRAWLKEDAHEFLERFRLENVVKTHSSFVPFPVLLGDERLNTTPALWREPKSSITREQYDQFYTHLSSDNTPPLDVLHLSVDAPAQFSALLFIPAKADPFLTMRREQQWGPDLYVNRVLIQRQQKDLLPDYLSFVKGVVDSEDLPLNISRETLQENAVLRAISRTLVKQLVSRLENLAQRDAEAYLQFWRAHGKIFKLGYSDYANKDRITPLLRFASSALEPEAGADNTEEGLTSLASYVERMPSEQTTIWYLAAPTREAAKANPHLEVFRRKGVEVLFLYEPVDEFALESLGDFNKDNQKYTFKAVEHADPSALDAFPDREAAPDRPAPLDGDELSAFDGLVATVREILGERVTDVRVSKRLTDSPACMTTPGEGVTSSMDRIMRVLQKDDSIPKKIFEINRDHALWRNLLLVHKSNPADAIIPEIVEGLFDTSMLMDGYLQNPLGLAARTTKLLEQAGAMYTELHKL